MLVSGVTSQSFLSKRHVLITVPLVYWIGPVSTLATASTRHEHEVSGDVGCGLPPVLLTCISAYGRAVLCAVSTLQILCGLPLQQDNSDTMAAAWRSAGAHQYERQSCQRLRTWSSEMLRAACTWSEFTIHCTGEAHKGGVCMVGLQCSTATACVFLTPVVLHVAATFLCNRKPA